MQYSDDALDLTVQSEGCMLNAYQDSVGVWTIGYGHTNGVCPGDSITPAQAVAYLREDLDIASAAVSRLVLVELSQGQFDALTDFVFNLGAGALEHSTLLALLNQGDYEGADQEFAKWVHAGGKVISGLVTRRRKEAALFSIGGSV